MKSSRCKSVVEGHQDSNISFQKCFLVPVLPSPYQNFPLQKQVDIELPEDLPLKEAHAIGESLQIKIEELPEVERAFVHLDYECDHKPEHSVLSRLPSSHA